MTKEERIEAFNEKYCEHGTPLSSYCSLCNQANKKELTEAKEILEAE